MSHNDYCEKWLGLKTKGSIILNHWIQIILNNKSCIIKGNTYKKATVTTNLCVYIISKWQLNSATLSRYIH